MGALVLALVLAAGCVDPPKRDVREDERVAERTTTRLLPEEDLEPPFAPPDPASPDARADARERTARLGDEEPLAASVAREWLFRAGPRGLAAALEALDPAADAGALVDAIHVVLRFYGQATATGTALDPQSVSTARARLAVLTEHAEPRVRRTAFGAYAHFSTASPASYAVLARGLDERDPATQAQCAESLRQRAAGDRRALRSLLDRLDAPALSTRYYAAYLLRELSGAFFRFRPSAGRVARRLARARWEAWLASGAPLAPRVSPAPD